MQEDRCAPIRHAVMKSALAVAAYLNIAPNVSN